MSKGSSKQITIKDELTEFLLYTSPNGEVKVEVLLNNETLWLTQKRIAELFGVQRPAITKHLKNIYEDGELEENSTSSILEHTAASQEKRQKKKHLQNMKNITNSNILSQILIEK